MELGTFWTNAAITASGLLAQVGENDDADNWPESAIAIAGITMITIIATVIIWQVLASWRARATVAREQAYRELAEQSTAAQQKAADEQQRIAAELTELRSRMSSIEKMMREVE